MAPSRSALALASSRVIFSSEPVNTTVLPATGELLLGFSASSDRDLARQPLDDAAVVALAEIGRDAGDHGVADLVERVHLGDGLLVALGDREAGVVERLPGAVAARQRQRRGLADLADAEREDERSSEIARRASIAANRLRTEVSP